MIYGKRTGLPSARFRILLGLGLAAGIAGCDSLLEVTVPGQMVAEDVFTPLMAESVVLSAVAKIECGYSTFIPFGSAHEDAWWRTSALYGAQAEYREERASNTSVCVTGGSSGGWYMGFQSGRSLAEEIYGYLEGWSDAQVQNRQQLMAIAATYAGIAYQMMGEVFCEVSVNLGPAMTPGQTLAEADRWLTIALQHINTTGDFQFRSITPSMKQLAHLIRARARLALGTNYAASGDRAGFLQGAAADATLIQPGFVAWITRDAAPNSRRNTFFWNHSFNTHGTIGGPRPDRSNPGAFVPFTGFRYLIIDPQGRAVINQRPVMEPRALGAAPTLGVADPRVPVEILPGHMGNDSQTQMYIQTKYPSYAADIPLARWAEAQLILAEVEGGQGIVNRINALRDVHGLPRFSSSNPVEIRDALIEERRRELFLEGRFWADKLRFDLWFPNGVGLSIPEARGNYGFTKCILMPLSEYQNNPNLRDGPDGIQFLR